jgi:hypothetical protein
MEEHRYTTPTHVREFTRYRAHVDFSQDRMPPAPADPLDRADTEPATGDEDARALGAADAPPGR